MKRDYLSASALKAFAKSPNHYLDYVQRKFEPSTEMKLGTLVHLLILEPKEFDNRYVVAPHINLRTKAGKAEMEQIQKENEGKEVIKLDFLLDAQHIVSKANANPTFRQLMETEFVAEQKVDGDIFGFPFTSRIDLETEGFVYDLKTTKDASPEGFMRAAHNLGYHIQAVIYRKLTGKKFRWVAIETQAPYNVAVYQQSEEAFMRVEAQVGNLVEAFKAWDGTPKGYTDKVLELDLPRWA